MKRLFFAGLFLAGTAFALHAQTEKTLASSATRKGGFGEFYTMYGQAAGQSGFGVGFDGALVLNDVSIGSFFQVEAFGDHRVVAGTRYNLGIGGLGLLLGYTYPSYKSVHLKAAVRVGPGFAILTNADNNDPFNNDDDYTDGILLVAPEVGVEFNLTHWLRLGVSGGYRIVNGVDHLPDLNSSSFNRPYLGLSLRAGGFGYKKA